MQSHSRNFVSPPPDAVRHATVAGMFYPAAPHELQQTVDTLLAQTQSPQSYSDQIVALLVPHAGYVYSGSVAAEAYGRLRGATPRTIVVIAPSHFKRFPVLSMFGGRAYATPLGEMPIAQHLVRELETRDEHFVSSWLGHDDHCARSEHALEVQLPFLQRVLPECDLLPIIMGEQSWRMCEVLARNLAKLATEHSLLLIASSDLSHYHEVQIAERMDQHCLAHLLAGQAQRLFEDCAARTCEACGAGPMVAALLFAQARHAQQIELLSYRHSGMVSGDYECVVGYAAVSFSRRQ